MLAEDLIMLQKQGLGEAFLYQVARVSPTYQVVLYTGYYL